MTVVLKRGYALDLTFAMGNADYKGCKDLIIWSSAHQMPTGTSKNALDVNFVTRNPIHCTRNARHSRTLAKVNILVINEQKSCNLSSGLHFNAAVHSLHFFVITRRTIKSSHLVITKREIGCTAIETIFTSMFETVNGNVPF